MEHSGGYQDEILNPNYSLELIPEGSPLAIEDGPVFAVPTFQQLACRGQAVPAKSGKALRFLAHGRSRVKDLTTSKLPMFVLRSIEVHRHSADGPWPKVGIVRLGSRSFEGPPPCPRGPRFGPGASPQLGPVSQWVDC